MPRPRSRYSREDQSSSSSSSSSRSSGSYSSGSDYSHSKDSSSSYSEDDDINPTFHDDQHRHRHTGSNKTDDYSRRSDHDDESKSYSSTPSGLSDSRGSFLYDDSYRSQSDNSSSSSSRSSSAGSSNYSDDSSINASQREREQRAIRQKLEAFIRKAIPHELPKLDAWMEEYKGREEDLIDVLYEKAENYYKGGAKSNNDPERNDEDSSIASDQSGPSRTSHTSPEASPQSERGLNRVSSIKRSPSTSRRSRTLSNSRHSQKSGPVSRHSRGSKSSSKNSSHTKKSSSSRSGSGGFETSPNQRHLASPSSPSSKSSQSNSRRSGSSARGFADGNKQHVNSDAATTLVASAAVGVAEGAVPSGYSNGAHPEDANDEHVGSDGFMNGDNDEAYNYSNSNDEAYDYSNGNDEACDYSNGNDDGYGQGDFSHGSNNGPSERPFDERSPSSRGSVEENADAQGARRSGDVWDELDNSDIQSPATKDRIGGDEYGVRDDRVGQFQESSGDHDAFHGPTATGNSSYSASGNDELSRSESSPSQGGEQESFYTGAVPEPEDPYANGLYPDVDPELYPEVGLEDEYNSVAGGADGSVFGENNYSVVSPSVHSTTQEALGSPYGETEFENGSEGYGYGDDTHGEIDEEKGAYSSDSSSTGEKEPGAATAIGAFVTGDIDYGYENTDDGLLDKKYDDDSQSSDGRKKPSGIILLARRRWKCILLITFLVLLLVLIIALVAGGGNSESKLEASPTSMPSSVTPTPGPLPTISPAPSPDMQTQTPAPVPMAPVDPLPPPIPTPTQTPTKAPIEGQTCFQTSAELQQAVDKYLTGVDIISLAVEYGPTIGEWCVGGISDFSNLFSAARTASASTFDDDISGWDVSRATNMLSMFDGASSFRGDLSNWNTARVTNMANMFEGASQFNSDLSKWVVSSVTDMTSMFSRTSAFNSDIGNWDVSRVTSMKSMFLAASAFNRDLSRWRLDRLSTMESIFEGARFFLQDLCTWGPQLAGRTVVVTDAFSRTRCPSATTAVDLTLAPPGPFCYTCVITPTPSPTVDNRAIELFDLLCPLLDGTECAALLNVQTAQGQAFSWLLSNTGFAFMGRSKKIQRFALAALFYSTGGDTSWTNSGFWLTNVDECLWFSTSTACTSDKTFVTLALDNNRLQGTIPPEIGLLTSLTSVSLRNPIDSTTKLSGSLPAQLGAIVGLESIRISGHALTVGGIPSAIGQLANLETLDLSHNELTGAIPPELGSITSVQRLFLNQNKLSGEVPGSLSGLTKLVVSRIDENDLTGVIPPAVCSVWEKLAAYADCAELENEAAPCVSFCCYDGQGCACRYEQTNPDLCLF